MQIGARSNGSGQIDFTSVSAGSLRLSIGMISLSYRFAKIAHSPFEHERRGDVPPNDYTFDSMILNRLSRWGLLTLSNISNMGGWEKNYFFFIDVQTILPAEKFQSKILPSFRFFFELSSLWCILAIYSTLFVLMPRHGVKTIQISVFCASMLAMAIGAI